MNTIIQTIIADYVASIGGTASFPPTLTTGSGTTYPTYNTWSTTNKASGITLSNGNLTAVGTSLSVSAIATNGVSSGKWYWETTINSAANANIMTGISLSSINVNAALYAQASNTAFAAYAYNGTVYNGPTVITPVGTPVAFNTVGTVVGIALDLTNNFIAWYKNGTLMVYCAIPAGQTWYPAIGDGTGSSWSQTANFGNTALSRNPPAGFTSGVGYVSTGFAATGGTITYNGPYTVHTFTSGGTFTPNMAGNVSALVVGGGGGGSGNGTGTSGGGGAGGLLTNTSIAVTATPYTVTVGGGGTGGTGSVPTATNGGNSTFATLTAIGGGHGAATVSGGVAGNGGSGGGGDDYYNNAAGTGTAGQGNNGGTHGSQSGGGGGGGAGAVGSAGTTVGGNGGVGISNSITGIATYYAGGGGGGGNNTFTGGTGGNGGGGAGGYLSLTAVNGTPNTGGGGGGGGGNPHPTGGAGGSGIVVITYPT